VREVEAYALLAGVYDEIVVDSCHGAWAAFLVELWTPDSRGVRDVLDVCCGTGLLAAELTALGYRVVGADASEEMLARARGLLGPEVELARAALPELTLDGTFDAVVCTFDGLNYLAPEDLRLTTTALARRLRPGGWFVFDVHTDAMMAFTAANPVVSGESEGHRFVISSSVDSRARTCDTRIELTPAGDVPPFREHHRQYFHSPAELRSPLAGAGFDVTSVTEEYSGRPVDESTLRATWVARLSPAGPRSARSVPPRP
jgi:SAM-dependent methyltransferase